MQRSALGVAQLFNVRGGASSNVRKLKEEILMEPLGKLLKCASVWADTTFIEMPKTRRLS
jgi:hypothetical protein